ncbi:MAG: type I 3-dehydroquinate dehydratase [Actinomycetaceae bacterium]|nr:type I 3-dehydroquinate dehydratase [Actinomycetaceae bacterium]
MKTDFLGLPTPAIIASLTAGSPDELRALALRAINDGAHVLEWRLDLMHDIGGGNTLEASAAVLEEVLKQASGEDTGKDTGKGLAKPPVIATLRTTAEGGQCGLDSYTELALRTLRTGCIDALDVEINREQAQVLIAKAHAAGVAVIASYHNWSQTPSEEKIVDILERMFLAGTDVAKIAVTPKTPDELDVLARAAKDGAKLWPQAMIIIGMGSIGQDTRLNPEKYKSVASFAALPGLSKPAAPGQFFVADMARAWNQNTPTA